MKGIVGPWSGNLTAERMCCELRELEAVKPGQKVTIARVSGSQWAGVRYGPMPLSEAMAFLQDASGHVEAEAEGRKRRRS